MNDITNSILNDQLLASDIPTETWVTLTPFAADRAVFNDYIRAIDAVDVFYETKDNDGDDGSSFADMVEAVVSFDYAHSRMLDDSNQS